jgi:hypothetical protein
LFGTYLLVVEGLGVLLGLVLGLLSVDVVKTLGLAELVDLSERGTTSDDLVRELALVVVVVGLLVRVGRFTWMLSVLMLHDHNL